MLLVPRHDFEAASSIARGINMDGGAVLRPGETLHPGLAFGSVAGPLDVLASNTHHVYGTGEDLLAQRTSGWYQALGLLLDGAVSLKRKLLTGEGRAPQSQLAAWARTQRCGVCVCPECELYIWNEFGVSAYLWPHLIPFVEACPWHGLLLVERCPLATRPTRVTKCERAHPDQIELSRYLLSLYSLCEKQAITAACRLALEETGFLHVNGTYHAKKFSDVFALFACGLKVHPTLRHLAAYPLRTRQILRWLGGNDTLNPSFILLMWMFVGYLGRDRVVRLNVIGGTSSEPRSSVAPRAWRGRKLRQSPVNVRTSYSIEDAASLFGKGCTCADVARLCRTSIDIVYRYVRKNGLRHLIYKAQHGRLSREARAAWLGRIKQFPHASANRLAKLEPRAFRWLYQNDHMWLRENWPAEPNRYQRKRADATAPHGQDAALCARIRAAKRAFKQECASHRPSLAALCRQLALTEYGLQRARRWRRVEAAVRRYLSG